MRRAILILAFLLLAYALARKNEQDADALLNGVGKVC